jgi:type I restriction enzyme M protein
MLTASVGGKRRYFIGDYEKYSWRKIMDPKVGAHERISLYTEALARLSKNENLPELFRNIFSRAYLPFNDGRTLSLFLQEIDYFDYKNSESLGDAYEYLLSIMGSQGDAGQFRTPRHIIDFIVDVVDPDKNDSVLDPACGTAGFLISAYKHVMAKYDGRDDVTGAPTKSEKKLSADERKKLHDNYFGFDIDDNMVKMAQVNMYLHGFLDPDITVHDTLSSEDYWHDKYDVILANPPFMSPKGGVMPHNKFGVESTRAEVLFVDYITTHLKPHGRAGIIVPEGIIFQSGTAYKQLRKNLVNDGLYAVVSLPSGVFNPYAGVKTSILLFDNELSKKTQEILFVKIENDGFDLGAQRREISKNDLPQAVQEIRAYRQYVITNKTTSAFTERIEKGNNAETLVIHHDKYILVKKTHIAGNGEYNLSGDRYRVATDYSNAKWPMVELGQACEITAGQSPEGKYYNTSGEGMPFYQGKTEFTDKYIGEPKHWTSRITKVAEKDDILMSVRAPVGPVNIATQKICIGRGLASLRPKKANILYVFGLLRSMQDSIKGNSGATFDSISKEDIDDDKRRAFAAEGIWKVKPQRTLFGTPPTKGTTPKTGQKPAPKSAAVQIQEMLPKVDVLVAAGRRGSTKQKLNDKDLIQATLDSWINKLATDLKKEPLLKEKSIDEIKSRIAQVLFTKISGKQLELSDQAITNIRADLERSGFMKK